MVGHTHEDIDALFGHISIWLRKHDALTLPGNLNTKGWAHTQSIGWFTYHFATRHDMLSFIDFQTFSEA